MTANDYIDSNEADRIFYKMRIVAQDPTEVGADGKVLLAAVDVPADRIENGPRGHRFYGMTSPMRVETVWIAIEPRRKEPSRQTPADLVVFRLFAAKREM